ncbi:MAG: hypothetical protein KVP17_002537 [Porospora cf. gigantea B]|uniref:uncharacterized protein n=1 Tax=Porospora cf. gigantea B TaxID=2853592 RepID=UPI003571E1AD|nr:MAG: hypothetical protein KVP17_002537 [Porospora cf. gigantea B]
MSDKTLHQRRSAEVDSALERGYSLQGDAISGLQPIEVADDLQRNEVENVIRERNTLLVELQAAEALQQKIQRENFQTELVFRQTINDLDLQLRKARRAALIFDTGPSKVVAGTATSDAELPSLKSEGPMMPDADGPISPLQCFAGFEALLKRYIANINEDSFVATRAATLAQVLGCRLQRCHAFSASCDWPQYHALIVNMLFPGLELLEQVLMTCAVRLQPTFDVQEWLDESGVYKHTLVAGLDIVNFRAGPDFPSETPRTPPMLVETVPNKLDSHFNADPEFRPGVYRSLYRSLVDHYAGKASLRR